MTEWFRAHPLITFVLLYVGMAFVYNKVFKTRRLPILKELIIYLLLGVGTLLLWLFQLDLQLPIVQSMAAAVSLMFIVRIRMIFVKRAEAKQGGSQPNGSSVVSQPQPQARVVRAPNQSGE